jgi:basic amino acid/polyamine antiporter, APA family
MAASERAVREGEPPPAAPALLRVLGAWDGALITIGAVVGTGIFLTTSDMARALPHPGLILLVWTVGGLLTLAGALSYAELGAMYPQAGGIYHFLKEAYGPVWGFLYGWASFLVIMSGGIAALAVGFGEYLGSFVPFLSTSHVLLSAPVGPWRWTLNGGQLAGVGAILGLTFVNQIGVKEGAWVQNGLTVLKLGAIAAFLVAGLSSSVPSMPLRAPLPAHALGGFGIAMIAALWTYDGWYGLTFSAGEIRNPARNLPLGIICGTGAIIALYVLVNVVYVRALSIEAIAANPRVGEAAAAALLGPLGARLLSAAVVVSAFGCLSSTILYSSRIYQPMAADGIFFRSLALIHPKYRTPVRSLWAQSGWAMLLTISGTYDQLYTYVVFAAVLFHAATGAAVIVLRHTHADVPRPYRVWAYPVVPVLFIVASGILVGNTLLERPVESLLGLLLVALGVPAYLYWRWRGRRA